MADIILDFLQQGGLAGVAGLMAWFAIKKDRQVAVVAKAKDKQYLPLIKDKDLQISKLYDRLEAKSDKHTELYLKLSTELGETVSALTEALESEEA